MKTYILKRVLIMIPNLIGITLISYLIMRLAPGDPAAMIVGTGVSGQMGRRGPSKEDLQRFREHYNLDKPWYVSYVMWLGKVATLDFGESMKEKRPVRAVIAEVIPVTLQLNLWSLLFIYLIAIPTGIYSAAQQYTWLDRVITVTLFVLYSLPSFWVATMALMLVCGGDYYNWFPVSAGETHDAAAQLGPIAFFFHRAWHLALPITVLSYAEFAFLSRQMRVGMLEQIRQDYVRTARAKGLSERVVVLKHALRNSLIPVVTLLGGVLPAILGGSVIVERIFSVRGMGWLDFDAILQRNFPVVMAITTVSALLTLVGILVSDILYVVVNPKIRLD